MSDGNAVWHCRLFQYFGGLPARRMSVPENIATEANKNSGVVKQAIASVIVDNNSDNLSAQERDLLQIFRNASGRKQIEIMQYMYKLEEEK